MFSWFTAWLDRRDWRYWAAQDDHHAAMCVLNIDWQPEHAEFWLSEAKRYAERAQGYRRGKR